MARRKRLTPPDMAPSGPLETKAMPFGPASVAVQGPFPGAPQAPVARVAGDVAQAAALRELSEAMTKAREDGRMVLELPLDAVEAGHLIRDRLTAAPEDMESLKDSLAESGQRSPIEVMDLGQGRYGLISGWRRLSALRALRDEGRGRDVVLALLRRPSDSAEAYRAMVEENEIRADLSHYERARIAMKSVEAGIFETEKAALQDLFRSASRARRSKIKSFMPIVTELDGHLRFPQALPERLGLRLGQALRDDPGLADRLRARLVEATPTKAEVERGILERSLAPPKPPKPVAAPADTPDPAPTPPRAAARGGPPDILLGRDTQGRLTLHGPGLTPDFVARLRAWIEAGAP